MRLILIPPYSNPEINWCFVYEEFLDDLENKGLIARTEIDIDPGFRINSSSELRDEEFLAHISLGTIEKVREYSEKGIYDAVVIQGNLDPGFAAARSISKIPVTIATHSAVHVASLIGERFSYIHTVAPSSLIIKRCIERYGFAHKLASVRFIGHSSTSLYKLMSGYSKNERANIPELQGVIADLTSQGIAAIEKDRADCLIIGCEPIESLGGVLRQNLDKAGYEEIPIITALASGIAVAKAMVEMKLIQSPRAYPTSALRTIPEFW